MVWLYIGLLAPAIVTVKILKGSTKADPTTSVVIIVVGVYTTTNIEAPAVGELMVHTSSTFSIGSPDVLFIVSAIALIGSGEPSPLINRVGTVTATMAWFATWTVALKEVI